MPALLRPGLVGGVWVGEGRGGFHTQTLTWPRTRAIVTNPKLESARIMRLASMSLKDLAVSRGLGGHTHAPHTHNPLPPHTLLTWLEPRPPAPLVRLQLALHELHGLCHCE